MRANVHRSEQAQRLDAIEGRIDRWLLLIFATLAAFGLVMVASSSVAVAEGFKVSEYHFVIRHAIFLAAGGLLALLIVRTELRWIEQRSQWLLIGCFVLLAAVYLPGLGRSVNGARRWIDFGIANFQVVEAVKLLLIVWLASYLKRYYSELQLSWRAMLKPIGVLAAMVMFLLSQPDFGSAMLLCSVVGGMLILGGVSLPRLLAPVLLGMPILAMVAISESYRIRRLTSFLDPWADPFKDGFQLTQALIAIGRGEWFGVGLGASVQKLFYLPEAHTDFILAVIAEELGFVGVIAVIALYAGFAGRAFWIGLRAIELRRLFAAYCAFGVTLWISLQALVSIGVNLGVLPTKGLTLPLISAGGSSVLMTCAAIGLLLRVSIEVDRAERQVALLRGDAALDDEFAVAPERAAPARARRSEPRMGAAA